MNRPRSLPHRAISLLLRLVAMLCFLALPLRADEAAALRAAMDKGAAGDWAGAVALAQGAGPVGADVVQWLRLRDGDGLLGDYEGFVQRRPDWPGLPFLRQKGEIAVARSTTPERVVAYFEKARPATAGGAIALTRALVGLGRKEDAAAEAVRAWKVLSFTPEEEAQLTAAFAPVLKAADDARLNRLLWQGRQAEARRMLPRVGPDARALAEARLAVQSDAAGIAAAIAAVPARLAADPGLAYDRFIWRMKKDRYADAAALIDERSTSAAALGDPGAWAERRALLARRLMRDGQPREAYRVASAHHLTSGAEYADLEFVAGFVALRKLGDPARALVHFGHLKAGVKTPISLSRALYWEARAHEAAGDATAAKAAYAAAAANSTTYYGLLAAERLGQSLDPGLLSDRRPPDWRAAGFAKSSVLQAARLLLAAGDRTLAKRFILHLAEGRTATELDQLAQFALELDEPHIAVLVAKQAAERGIILPRAYFPVPGLVPDGQAVSRALALAIARRESEFDPAAISPAGARGLMQVMPGTAKLMSQATGQDFATERLTGDPAYNVAMGTAYLRKLVDEFGPSIALVAAGYNAGPARPRAWVGQFGDPRDPAVDVVDWVETIPFTETRTYVMRVVEGVVIYRAKLKGKAGPVRISAELRG